MAKRNVSGVRPRADTMRGWLEAVRSVRVLVLGDAMLDHYVWGDSTRISPEAPVPVVQVQRETYTAGGAANVALNLRALGAQAHLFGSIGRDEKGRQLVKLLEEQGVAVERGGISAKVSTIVKTRIICRNQQLCRLDYESPSNAPALDAKALRKHIAPLVGEVDAVILSDYAKGMLATDAISELQTLVKPPRIVALDPKPRRRVAYQGVDLLTPNRAEALQLAGLDEADCKEFPAEEVCARIYERCRPAKLVVTMGAEGMLLSEGGKVIEQIPAVAREVFDVSGAGDTVIAALTMALAAGLTLSETARFANTAAGVVVGKLGTATASPEEMLAYCGARP